MIYVNYIPRRSTRSGTIQVAIGADGQEECQPAERRTGCDQRCIVEYRPSEGAFFILTETAGVQIQHLGAAADHPYPTLTKNYHYECELVVALKSGGRDIPMDKDAAREAVYGMPFADWKARHQREASPEQLAAFEAAQPRHD